MNGELELVIGVPSRFDLLYKVTLTSQLSQSELFLIKQSSSKPKELLLLEFYYDFLLVKGLKLSVLNVQHARSVSINIKLPFHELFLTNWDLYFDVSSSRLDYTFIGCEVNLELACFQILNDSLLLDIDCLIVSKGRCLPGVPPLIVDLINHLLGFFGCLNELTCLLPQSCLLILLLNLGTCIYQSLCLVFGLFKGRGVLL